MSSPRWYMRLKKKLDTCEENTDTRKLWKNVLGWLNWSSASSPTKLVHEGRIVTSPSKIADIQNQFYIQKVHTIRQELPQSGNDPLKLLRQRLHGNSASFSFSAVTPDEVDKIIGSLKNSKASGIDDLDTYILKLIKKDVVPSVCHIVNLSIQTNKFPNRWKIPILSKVLERSVFLQIVRYMDNNRLFNPNHHAYRSFHSTTTAMR